MKRFCVFVGVICLMLCAIATRLYFNRLSTFLSGEYTAFNSDDLPFSPAISKGYERVDVQGNNVQDVIEKLKCKIIKIEQIEDITIYYCYSPFILKSVYLFNNDINIMIARTGSKVVVGSPLIKGSF